MKRWNLWEENIPYYDETAQRVAENDGTPTLDIYLADASKNPPRGIVMACPGGSYGFRAEHEGKGMAEFLNEHGIHAAVLNYRVAPYRYPAALCDAARGIRLLRLHAGKLGIDVDKIAVMGSSAGGHLAASLATCYDEAPRGTGKADQLSARPDLAILCYPVITSGPYTHSESIKNILGPSPSEEELARVSIEKRVTEHTPPMFIWHTNEDEAVPAENSLLLAQALRDHHVPVTLHLYESGHHGLGLAKGTECEGWSTLMVAWLKKHWQQ